MHPVFAGVPASNWRIWSFPFDFRADSARASWLHVATGYRETRMDAPTLIERRRAARRNRFAKFALIMLGAVLALGAWQGFGVLLYGIEGSYEH
jgi:hypothetical protein